MVEGYWESALLREKNSNVGAGDNTSGIFRPGIGEGKNKIFGSDGENGSLRVKYSA